MRPLVVGLAPGRLPSGGRHVVPLVGSSSGRRLAALCGLDSQDELADHFELVNLYRTVLERGRVQDWDDARRRALNFNVRGRQVVLLGGQVWRAFGMRPTWHPFIWHVMPPGFPASIALSPHPSGRTRYWNDPTNVELGELFWRELVERSDDGRTQTAR